ncbi:MAG: hypothetical protein HY822_05975 [Acidobacteria bacterium]|nr:hypothetical protein [Acidobacteriota bacterium]
MRLKSYFAATVEAALGQARKEMGEDSLLVNSRKAPPEARHLGECEVVCAAAEDPPAAAPPPAPAERWDRLAREVAALRRQVERTAATLSRSVWLAGSAASLPPELAGTLAELAAAGMSHELAREIVEQARRRCLPETAGRRPPAREEPPLEADRWRAAVASEISARRAVEATLGGPGEVRAVVALVGPPGAGKTTTLVKMAATYGLAARRPAQILSTDTQRIAAAEQLRVYAGILGIGFQVAETAGALAQALEEHRGKDLILIDTPGLGPRDGEQGQELARFLSRQPEMDTHLVLSATMKTADLAQAAERFESFQPRKLIFTRLDETEALGSVVTLLARTGKPCSFVSEGQRIPEDLAPATRERFAGLALGRAAMGALAAA